MIRNLRFYRDDGLWYVDLPEWEGDRDELLMVAGADTMLEVLGGGKSEVSAITGDEPFKDAFILHLIEYHEEDNSGTYWVEVNDIGMPVWLCHVTSFVFGKIPNNVYILPILES